MKIVSANLNGIRAAFKNGFGVWLEKEDFDIVCLQETKAHVDSIPEEFKNIKGYHSFFHSAEKKGYSGVGIYSKYKPENVIYGIGNEDFDKEGRFLQIEFEELIVISLYLPSGASGEDRQEIKYDFMNCLYDKMKDLLKLKKDVIICGDWNIAHTEMDIKNWKGNVGNSGFLPEERAWLSKLFRNGWVDVFRSLNKNENEFTWWAYWGNAWKGNIGWRIDYQIATPNIAEKAVNTYVYKDERFSDHAPLIVEYNI